MAKLLEPCMFCEQLPCTCNAKPTKKKVTRTAVVSDTSTARRAVSKSVVVKDEVRSEPKKTPTRKHSDELRAIRVLAWLNMLDQSALKEHAHLLATPSTGQLLKYL